MISKHSKKSIAVALVFGAFSFSADAALVDYGNGMIYDSDQDITWLKDANYALIDLNQPGRVAQIISNVGSIAGHTLTEDDFHTSNGSMTWWGSMAWVQDLNFNGISGWRLPKIIDTGTPGCNFANSGTDCGYNVDTATSEMAHVFFNELPGNSSWANSSGVFAGPYTETGVTFGLLNAGPFINMANSYLPSVANYAYFSSTVSAVDSTKVWAFRNDFGYQDAAYAIASANGDHAWAVHDGNVAAVPLPGAVWLMGSTLAGISLLRKRRSGVIA